MKISIRFREKKARGIEQSYSFHGKDSSRRVYTTKQVVLIRVSIGHNEFMYARSFPSKVGCGLVLQEFLAVCVPFD